LLYGSETWVTTTREENGVEAAEMRFLRSVKGFTGLDKLRSEDIGKERYVSSVQEIRSRYKQNWINHLERMDDSRLPKCALYYKPTGRKFVDVTETDGDIPMPEQAIRPNPWTMMMMMKIIVNWKFFWPANAHHGVCCGVEGTPLTMSDCEGCAVADRYLSVIGLEAR
jgi:hypothetical protein